MIVAVSTNPAIDRIALADGAAAGGLVRARELLVTAGGKAAHVASVAAALGADARLVAPAGGELFGALLGVPATLVPVAEPTRGTYTVVDPAAGDVIEVHEPSPALSAGECDALVAAAGDAAAGAAVVVIAGSLPAGAPADLHARLLRACGAAFTVLDTSTPSALEVGLAAEPDLVTPNAGEAAALLGAADDPALVRALRDRGAGAAWLSAGERGSVLATGDGTWHLAGPRPEAVVNAVGAGDALVGGLAAGLARGLGLLDAAALGTAAATDKLRHLDSGRVDGAAVERLLAAVRRRQIAPLP
jgi:1-phosphofructokinase family hexose kinase